MPHACASHVARMLCHGRIALLAFPLASLCAPCCRLGDRKVRGRRARKSGSMRKAILVSTGAPANQAIDEIAARKKKEPEPEPEPEKPEVDFGAVMAAASKKAFRGGVAGFAAGVIQVFTFMWLRTTMNYQYMNGGNMTSALSALYAEGAAGKSGMAATLGGIGRFYKGVQFAVVQNPLSRFGDTAANQGILAIADAYFPGAAIGIKTAFASVGGATWRIFIMPVDTYKTTMQVQGAKAVQLLNQKVAKGGIGVLYSGAAASFAANWVGNYPWFATVRARGHARTRASGNPLANSS